MALKNGDTGAEVTQLQRELIALGYPLPRWGADGQLGGETLQAALKFLLDHGFPANGLILHGSGIDDDNRENIRDVYIAHQNPDIVTPPAGLIDRRKFTDNSKDIGQRRWDQITGWCLHQTACHLGASARIERCDNVGAHFVVYQDGRIFWLHDLNRKIIHGNGWNATTIGIEIDGLFAGIEGNPATVWDDPSTKYQEKAMSLTPAQTEATKALMRWNYRQIAAQGGRVSKIVAHRQSSNTRRNDPGSKPWRDIALPMMAELQCDAGGPGFALHSGRPIPVEWDPRSTEKY